VPQRRAYGVSFGRVLRRRRVAAGLSQEALAEAAGLHPRAVQHYEAGTREPSLTALVALAEGLRVEPGQLVTEAVAE